MWGLGESLYGSWYARVNTTIASDNSMFESWYFFSRLEKIQKIP